MNPSTYKSNLVRRLENLGIKIENVDMLTDENIASLLTEEEIHLFFNFSTWTLISKCPGLSEAFIDKYADHLYWKDISKHQNLSESMILKYRWRLYMPYIAKYQKLSNDMKHKLHIIEIVSTRKVGLVKYITI
jgi:hypothetical protein